MDYLKYTGLDGLNHQDSGFYSKVLNSDMQVISENIEVLIPYMDKITVKKNKRFRKGSVSKLFVIESASSYFTDYTNAWATKELVIRAISEDAVVLDFRRVVLTY